MSEGDIGESGVTIGPRHAADSAEVLDLLVTVFDDSPREWFEAGICDPPYPEGTGFVARADGRIVSHVEVMDMPLRFGEATLHTGAITGVVTLPEWRRRGLASRLMERATAEMERRGWPLALLLTGSHGFYERLGWCRWAPPGRALTWNDALTLARALPAAEGYTAGPFSAADLPEMIALHARYNAGRPGTLPRPERYWRSILKRWLEATEYPDQYSAIHSVRHGGRLVAYGFSCIEDGALQLYEVAYQDEAAVPALLRAMIEGAGHARNLPHDAGKAAQMIATVPPDSALVRWMDTNGNSTPNPLDCVMWRINDLAGLLQQAHPVLERRLGGRGEGGCILAFDRMQARVEVRSGLVRITGLASAASPAAGTDLSVCSLSQADLVTLLLGSYESPTWLDALPLPDSARELIESLFPPAGGIFWLTDNF